MAAQPQEKGKLAHPDNIDVEYMSKHLTNVPSGIKIVVYYADGKDFTEWLDPKKSSNGNLMWTGQIRDRSPQRINPDNGEVTRHKSPLVMGVNATYAYSSYTIQQLDAGLHKPKKAK